MVQTSASNNYKYTISDLVKLFSDNGYKVSHSWVYRQEIRGKLNLPRSTTNIKSVGHLRSGAVRILTKNQMEQIVKAFLPNGIGYWHYR